MKAEDIADAALELLGPAGQVCHRPLPPLQLGYTGLRPIPALPGPERLRGPSV